MGHNSPNRQCFRTGMDPGFLSATADHEPDAPLAVAQRFHGCSGADQKSRGRRACHDTAGLLFSWIVQDKRSFVVTDQSASLQISFLLR